MAKKKATKKADSATPVALEDLLRKPSVIAFLSEHLAQSDREVRQGPGGTGWGHGNETKREGIEDLNAALHALSELAGN